MSPALTAEKIGQPLGTIPRPRKWRCLWEGCPQKGQWTTAPLGVTIDQDADHHHRTVHGVPVELPVGENPALLARLRSEGWSEHAIQDLIDRTAPRRTA